MELQLYIPSTVEKKRVITYFVFLGLLMIFVTHRPLSVYERYYAELMIGWRSCMFLSLLLAIVALLIPLIGWLYILYLLVCLALRVIAISQSWQWIYGMTFPVYRFLGGIGSWILNLFDIQIDPSSPSDNIPSSL